MNLNLNPSSLKLLSLISHYIAQEVRANKTSEIRAVMR